jgi:hypothetical protein
VAVEEQERQRTNEETGREFQADLRARLRRIAVAPARVRIIGLVGKKKGPLASGPDGTS